MFSSSCEEIVSKNYTYNGQLYLELKEKCFSFRPTNGIRQLSIFYNISGYKFDGESLIMKIKRSQDEPSTIKIIVEKNDRQLHKEVIFELSLETPPIMMDTLKEEYQTFKKSLQMFGQYNLRSWGKILEAVFKHHDGSEYTVMVNEHSKIYEVYLWLCEIWTKRCECTEYCISTKEGLNDESRKFIDCGFTGHVEFDVAERCYVHPFSKEGKSLVMPWNKKCSVLLKYLANMLGINVDEVRLLDSMSQVLREGLKLDIAKFREENTKKPPQLWFDVTKTTVKCIPMNTKGDSIEIVILKDCNAEEIKIKLEKKLNVSKKRFIISQKEKLLVNEDILEEKDTVEYYIGSTLDDISSKVFVGQGSFGEVFKCTKKSSNEVIALKQFIIPSNNEQRRTALIREIEMMLNIPPHDNLVRYLDIYVDDIEIYIGMEYMEKGSLKKYIDDNGGLSENLIKKFLKGIVTGLAHLHENSVNHRDIKGDNVLLGENDIAKLCDFGISKKLTNYNSKGYLETVNQTKKMGTTRYMAPEVMNGENYAFPADIWSVGATIVEMITGKYPYPEMQEPAVINKIGQEKKIEFVAVISEPLRYLVDCCLKPIPRERPSSSDLLEFEFLKDK